MKKIFSLVLMALCLQSPLALGTQAYGAQNTQAPYSSSVRGSIGETSTTLGPPSSPSSSTLLAPSPTSNLAPNSANPATPYVAPSTASGIKATSPYLSPPAASQGSAPLPAGTKPGLDIYNSVAPTVAPVPEAGRLQERNLPASPLPATTDTPADSNNSAEPKAPTAAEIEAARKQEALRQEQEAERQRQLAAAQEKLRQEQSYLAAAKAHAQGDYKKAIDIWAALAKEGHVAAMTAMGLIYDRGQGVLLNSKEAVMWFRLAADGGDKNGMFHLGRMLAQGRGGRQHFATAATWLQKAAELGQHDAQYLLAVLYERGQGVVQDDSTAAAWYSLAAAGQNIEAGARLGHLYRIGKGVPQNLERATLLLYGATMAGHKGAQEELFALSQEAFKDKGFPKVTLFGADFAAEKGLTRAQMRSALSVSKVKPIREDTSFICDVYDLTGTVPGAHQMAVCYGAKPEKSSDGTPGHQEMGFLKIDYTAKSPEHAKAIQNMVEKRFGTPAAGEQGQGYLWNLGRVIVATQYIPQKEEVGLMYMIPRVYHTTQGE